MWLWYLSMTFSLRTWRLLSKEISRIGKIIKATADFGKMIELSIMLPETNYLVNKHYKIVAKTSWKNVCTTLGFSSPRTLCFSSSVVKISEFWSEELIMMGHFSSRTIMFSWWFWLDNVLSIESEKLREKG